MPLVFYMALGLYDFDGGQMSNFWAQMALASLVCHFRAQKSLDFHSPPLSMVLDFPIKIIMSLSSTI
jgi:hypothetical protein